MQGTVEDLQLYAPYLGRDVEAVFKDLQGLTRLLLKWQRVQNLVSRETRDNLWTRHILDSLQLLPLMPRDSIAFQPVKHAQNTGFDAVSSPSIVDIGSGGGFPALPLAIALKGLPVGVQMIESNGRKCAFLNAAIREFGLQARVHNGRIEDIDAEKLGSVALVTSRALASLPLLLGYIAHIAPNGRALLHKGREYGEEVKEADSVWAFDVVKHDSVTDPQGVILDISKIRRR